MLYYFSNVLNVLKRQWAYGQAYLLNIPCAMAGLLLYFICSNFALLQGLPVFGRCICPPAASHALIALWPGAIE